MQFSQYEERDAVRCSWNVLPVSKADSKKLQVPIATLYTPLKPIENLGQVTYRPLQCGGCGAILNPYSPVNYSNRTWTCVFCKIGTRFPANYAGMTPQQLPAELQPSYTTLEYVLEAPGQQQGRSLYVFVIDTSMTEPEELAHLTKAIANSIQQLPQGACVSIIGFGKHAHLYDLSSEDGLRSITFRGDKEVTPSAIREALGDVFASKKPASSESKLPTPPPGVPGNPQMTAAGAVAPASLPQAQSATPDGTGFVVPVSECELQLHNVLESLCLDAWQNECSPDKRPARCTGTAITLATSLMDLCSVKKRDNVRLMLYVGGACSYGPGTVVSELYSDAIRSYWQVIRDQAPYYASARAFYDKLAAHCYSNGYVVDILAGSLDQYGLGEMKNLVELTGGAVVLDDSFSHGCFQGSHKRMFAPDPLTGAQRLCHDVELTAYTSSGLKIQGAVGKLTSLNKKTSMVSDNEVGVGKTTTWRLCGADENTTPCIIFEAQDFTPDQLQANTLTNQIPQSYVQFVSKYRNSFGQTCIRVTTISRSHVSFISKQGRAHLMLGFDPAAAAVILTKLGIHNVNNNMRFEGHRWVDEILIKLVSTFHDYTQHRPETLQLSTNFAEFAKYIYLLRRTEVFRYFSFSIDESTYARLVALHETTNNVMRVIEPELIAFPLDSQPYTSQLTRDAAQSSRVLLLDNFLMLVIWYPNDVASWREQKLHLDPAYEGIAEMLRGPVRRVTQILETRFPCPRFVECVGKLSQSRFFFSRVPTIKGDPSKVTHNVGLKTGPQTASSNANEAPRDDADDDLTLDNFMNHLRFLACKNSTS